MTQHQMTQHRIEKDSMGEVRVPANAYFGAQTQRAPSRTSRSPALPCPAG